MTDRALLSAWLGEHEAGALYPAPCSLGIIAEGAPLGVSFGYDPAEHVDFAAILFAYQVKRARGISRRGGLRIARMLMGTCCGFDGRR